MAAAQVERRLAAILAADVVGYSRLMEADEAGTFARLKELRRELIEPILRQHGGRFVDLKGDGAIVEFQSVTSAVEAAVAVQRAMRAHDPDLPEDRRIRYRIGINLGDVIIDGETIQATASTSPRGSRPSCPGGVWVSRSVHNQVKGKLDLHSPPAAPGQEHQRRSTFRCSTASVSPSRLPHRRRLHGGRSRSLTRRWLGRSRERAPSIAVDNPTSDGPPASSPRTHHRPRPLPRPCGAAPRVTGATCCGRRTSSAEPERGAELRPVLQAEPEPAQLVRPRLPRELLLRRSLRRRHRGRRPVPRPRPDAERLPRLPCRELGRARPTRNRPPLRSRSCGSSIRAMSLEMFLNTNTFAREQEMQRILASARKAGVRPCAGEEELSFLPAPTRLPECLTN